MSYKVQTERVDLKGGHWIEVYTEVLHRTNRLTQELVQPYLKINDGQATMTIDKEGEISSKVEGQVEVDLTEVPLDAIDDIAIVNQIASWSFGDTVDQAALDSLPERIRGLLKTEVNRRFAAPLAGSDEGNSEKEPSSLSRKVPRFPWVSRKP